MKKFAKLLAVITALALTAACLPALAAEEERVLVFSGQSVTLDGVPLVEGEEGDVTLSRDIIYYEEKTQYDSGNPYGEGTEKDMHSADEAAAHLVVTIRAPGTYRVSGTLSLGQLAIDLGSDAKRDPSAVVTLILDGVDITCEVAPGVIFYKVFECDTAFVAYDEGETEDYTPSPDHDLSAAGARVVIADGTVNTVRGSYVAKIYKDNGKQKKLHKYDGAFYSKMSMTVTGGDAGDGVLDIIAGNEGLDDELHLALNGGNIHITSQDDGINTNEDGVSATIINGGSLHIVAGLGAEGDGIDSNGYLTINGGTVISIAKPNSDSGLDSDMGSVINGGTVVATGSTMDWPETDSDQVTLNLQFSARQADDEAIIVTDLDGKVIFAYDPDKDAATGSYNRGYQGAVLSCPAFQVGETYQVYVGGDVQGEQVDGVYDAATVTGFTGAVRQQYTGTDVRRGFGGMRPGGFDFGQRPDGFDPAQFGDRGQRPEGFDPAQFGDKGQRPDGFDRGRRPEDGQQPPDMPADMTPPDMPADGQPPEDFDPSRFDFNGPFDPSGQGVTTMGEPSTRFYMQDKVNFFSGLTDETVAYVSSASQVEVDGAVVDLPMYALRDANGYETNYVKVRDVAHILSASPAKFQVDFEDGAVTIRSRQDYLPNGSEMSVPFTGERFYQKNAAATRVDGADIAIDSILLQDDNGGGYTYYQLRDLGKALGFNVRWDGDRGLVCVDTALPYQGV